MIEVLKRSAPCALTAEDLLIYTKSCRGHSYFMRQGDRRDAEIMFAATDAKSEPTRVLRPFQR